jgi:hypothetical protein
MGPAFNWVTAMMQKLITAAAILALWSGAAYAQTGSLFPTGQEPKPRLSPEEQQRQDELERNYRETVSKMPDRKGSNDPWGNVRAAPPTAAKQQQK